MSFTSKPGERTLAALLSVTMQILNSKFSELLKDGRFNEDLFFESAAKEMRGFKDRMSPKLKRYFDEDLSILIESFGTEKASEE